MAICNFHQKIYTSLKHQDGRFDTFPLVAIDIRFNMKGYRQNCRNLGTKLSEFLSVLSPTFS